MDFLNKAIAQVTDLFRSMTPGARITAGLLLAVLVVSLGYLFNHQSSSADAFLMGGDPIPSSQLAAIEGAFAKAKLGGYDIDASHRIRVPSGQKEAYMAALVDGNALPRGFGDHMINAIKEVGPFGSQKQQKELLKIGQERELAQTISYMHGMESASVMFDIETEPGLSVQRAVKTAAVSVKPQGNEPLEEDRVQAIRYLVAGSIGCKPTDISVVDLNTDRTFPGGSTDSSGGGALDNEYGDKKRKYEKEWEAKVRDALAFIPTAIIKVNVELNPETVLEQREDKFEKPVPIDEEENSRTLNTQTSGAGGKPGLAAQGGVLNSNTPAALASAGGPKTEEESKKSRVKSAPTQTQLLTKKAGLTPSRVTVTVGVPSNYYEQVWRARTPTAGADTKPDANAILQIETAEKTRIQEYVAQLIPKPNTTVQEVTPLVTVMTFQHLPSTPITPPSTADKALFWLSQSWSTLGMIGLGMVSLLVLRSMVRVVPAAERLRTEAAPVAAAPAGDEEETVVIEQQQEAAARLKRRAKSGPSLRDELVEIVREDPDSAANILRNWIGGAT